MIHAHHVHGVALYITACAPCLLAIVLFFNAHRCSVRHCVAVYRMYTLLVGHRVPTTYSSMHVTAVAACFMTSLCITRARCLLANMCRKPSVHVHHVHWCHRALRVHSVCRQITICPQASCPWYHRIISMCTPFVDRHVHRHVLTTICPCASCAL